MEITDFETLGRALSVRTYLATVGADGAPDVVPVHPAWEGTTMWVMTGASSVKARNIGHNPQVAMHWETNEAGDGLQVWGHAEVVGDQATKDRLWTGVFDYDLDLFAPEGRESPDVVFLRITPERAIHAYAYGMGGIQRWKAS